MNYRKIVWAQIFAYKNEERRLKVSIESELFLSESWCDLEWRLAGIKNELNKCWEKLRQVPYNAGER